MMMMMMMLSSSLLLFLLLMMLLLLVVCDDDDDVCVTFLLLLLLLLLELLGLLCRHKHITAYCIRVLLKSPPPPTSPSPVPSPSAPRRKLKPNRFDSRPSLSGVTTGLCKNRTKVLVSCDRSTFCPPVQVVIRLPSNGPIFATKDWCVVPDLNLP